jgi:hypothetical protein
MFTVDNYEMLYCYTSICRAAMRSYYIEIGCKKTFISSLLNFFCCFMYNRTLHIFLMQRKLSMKTLFFFKPFDCCEFLH